MTLRNIDFSYNRLNFNIESPECEDSLKFVKNLCYFLENAIVMTHLKLSGMELGQ